MHNWHRALCSTSEEAEWGGEFDPAYQPQQVIGDDDYCDYIHDCDDRDQQRGRELIIFILLINQ